MRRAKFIVPAIVGLVFFFIPALTQDPYWLDVLVKIGLWVMLTLGFQLMMTAGIASVAQAAFMGIGAYTSTLLVMKVGFNFWAAFPLAGIVAGLFALLIGIPALRTKGVYLIMVTLALSQVLRLIWTRWVDLFGGAQGILNIPPPSTVNFAGLNIEFGYGHFTEYYYLVFLVTLVCAVIVYRLNWSRFGMTCKAINEAQALTMECGVYPLKYKLVVFAAGCFLAGLAGSLQAHYLFYISSETFPLLTSMYVIVYGMIGGTAGVAGPILGPLIMVLVSEELRFLREYMPMLFGVILVLVMSFLPDGLMSLPRLAASTWKNLTNRGQKAEAPATEAKGGVTS